MNSTGIYKEKLWFGAELTVYSDDWLLKYLPYGKILSEDIVNLHVEYLLECWMKYEEFSETLISEGRLSIAFSKQMTIELNSKFPGIDLDYLGYMVTTKDQIEEVIACLKFARRRAEKIQSVFKSLQ